MHQPVLSLYPFILGSLTWGANLCMQLHMTALKTLFANTSALRLKVPAMCRR